MVHQAHKRTGTIMKSWSKIQNSNPAEEPANRPIPQHPDALLFTVEAAFLLGLSPRTLEAHRISGEGAPYIAVTPKAIRYRRSDLESWIAARRRTSTSDSGRLKS